LGHITQSEEQLLIDCVIEGAHEYILAQVYQKVAQKA